MQCSVCGGTGRRPKSAAGSIFCVPCGGSGRSPQQTGSKPERKLEEEERVYILPSGEGWLVNSGLWCALCYKGSCVVVRMPYVLATEADVSEELYLDVQVCVECNDANLPE